jgi:hypothetical protein
LDHVQQFRISNTIQTTTAIRGLNTVIQNRIAMIVSITTVNGLRMDSTAFLIGDDSTKYRPTTAISLATLIEGEIELATLN